MSGSHPHFIITPHTISLIINAKIPKHRKDAGLFFRQRHLCVCVSLFYVNDIGSTRSRGRTMGIVVVYYCRTYVKAVRGGGREKGVRVLWDATSRGLCGRVGPPRTHAHRVGVEPKTPGWDAHALSHQPSGDLAPGPTHPVMEIVLNKTLSLRVSESLSPLARPLVFGGCAFLPFSLGPTGDCSCRY